MLQESKKEHGALAQRIIDIDNLYQILAELECKVLLVKKFH